MPCIWTANRSTNRAGAVIIIIFPCNVCGRVYSLDSCPVALPNGTVYPGGFVVEGHEVTLYGRCPQCA